MGTTLCNINLYNPNKAEYDAGKEFCIAHITENWDTILEVDNEHNFDRISKLAASLSKSLDTNAVVTVYFDDDIFGLDVYAAGKVKAFYHSGYEGIETKGSTAMAGILDLDSAEAKAFRYLLKKEMSASDAISMFSAVCGLPFYVDKLMFDEIPDKLIPDKEAVFKKIDAEKAKTKKTQKKSNKAELLCEIPGTLLNCGIDYDDDKNGVVRVIKPDDTGVDYSHIYCYQITNNDLPTLTNVFEYSYPFDKWAPGDEARFLTKFFDFLAVFDDHNVVVCELDKKDEIANAISLGQIPGEALISAGFEPASCSYVRANELPVNPGKLERLADADIGSDIFVLDDQKVKIENGYIIRLAEYNDYEKKEQFIVADFFDKDKKYLRTELIPIDDDLQFYAVNADYCYIEEKDELIIGEYILDFKNKTLSVSDTFPAKMEYIIRRTLKDGQEVLVVQSGKKIMVFDMDYKLINSTSVKQRIVERMFDREDNILVVTSTNTLGLGYKLEHKAGDTVALYKIALLTNK
ncbi:MAG: hypothetical protein J5504_02520 [Butyrivibrio sp.]|nr:hypothetical protein [Butyrivibrio sp.]